MGLDVRITPKLAREFFDYNPKTGALTWRRWFNVHRRGDPVGGPTRGYLQVTILRKTYLVHRLCWMVQAGEEPPPIIDHADGDGMNNRWSNLREATVSQNAFNRAFRKVPRGRLPVGIIQHPTTKMYRAKITQDGSTWASAWFDAVDDAVAARAEKAVEMYGEFGARVAAPV